MATMIDTSFRNDALHALRARMRRRRARLTPPERMVAAQGLRRSLERLPAYAHAPRIAGYWACRGEMPLNLAIAPLAQHGQHFYLPLLDVDRQLRFARWRSGDVVTPNRFGIPEPEAPTRLCAPTQLDLVLLPLLAFSRDGVRVGAGGGFYDTTFAFLRDQQRPTKPLLVGVGYAFQEQAALPSQTWDVALDYVATERELIQCQAATVAP